MNEDLFLAFLAVVDSGSFSGAARKIHLTQPAISQRIKNLEDLVEAPLFERAPGRSRPKLTEVGRIVEEEARHSLMRWTAMKAEIRSLSTLEHGEVTIGGGATAVSFLLPKLIAKQLSKHPNLVIRVRESGSAEVVKRVINGELDCGIITKHHKALPSHLNEIPLINDQIVAVVSDRHPLSLSTEELEPAALNGEKLVAYESKSVIGEVISNALGQYEVQAQLWTELRSIQSILEIARLTSSVALVSTLSEKLWLGMTRLNCPKLELEMQRSLVLIWNNERSLSPASQSFLSTLTEI